MSDRCELRKANGLPEQPCDREECVYWRIAGYLGDGETGEGCAIQHYELLGDEAVVQWLLSVKERIERVGSGPVT
jgi:hypothetical protein